jgi:hypothetical protein
MPKPPKPSVTLNPYRALDSSGLPIGSGVTEAACKTVYTQRLKLSGMRWKRTGAQTILNLRILLLSGVWEAAYQRVLQSYEEPNVATHATSNTQPVPKAA